MLSWLTYLVSAVEWTIVDSTANTNDRHRDLARKSKQMPRLHALSDMRGHSISTKLTRADCATMSVARHQRRLLPIRSVARILERLVGGPSATPPRATLKEHLWVE